MWRRTEGMEHACTQGDLVRVRAADRRGEGPPTEQGSGHDHAALYEGRQRETPGHHLGRVRTDRQRPRPRRVRERRLDEADAKALGRRSSRGGPWRSEEHTSELQSLTNIVCRLLLEKKKTMRNHSRTKYIIVRC